jgi:hypothetical protein
VEVSRDNPGVIALGGVNCSWELHMDRRDLPFVAGMLVSLFVSIFLPIISAFVLSGKQWKAAEERARARRIAEHRMNARLLRLDI